MPLCRTVAALACVFLVSCAATGPAGDGKTAKAEAKKGPPAGYLIAADAFKKPKPAAGAKPDGKPAAPGSAQAGGPGAAPAGAAGKSDAAGGTRPAAAPSPAGGAGAGVSAVASAGADFVPTLSSTRAAFVPRVLLYASATSRSYLQAGGFDAEQPRRAWETVLGKYKIPFKVATRADDIDRSDPVLLILPSTLALSNRERQAIVDFRARGGSVLATWATGVRSESGAWLGFGFMERALDTKVVGSTAGDKNDNYMMPRGESPVTHSLPAGHRIWTERVAEWFPLRMAARNPSIHIMDWSRNFRDDAVTTIAHYDERTYANGSRSRIVAFGMPERLWQTSEPKLVEALIYDTLVWLLHLPSATVAAWPGALPSALLFAIDNSEVVLDGDITFGSYLEDAGVRATIYTVGDFAKKSAPRLKTLLGRGHELALEADKFAAFAGQSKDVQAARIDSALANIREAGLPMPAHPSFHAPMEAYDKTTEALIRQRGFGHYIAKQDASEALLPLVIPPDAAAPPGSPSVVVFPRAQRGPEEAAEEGDIEDALKSFYAEFAATVQMRGMSIVRIPNQGLLPLENLREVADELKRYRGKLWTGTATQIANWWRDRARVSAWVEGTAAKPMLAVQVAEGAPLQHAVTTIVYPPHADAQVALERDGQIEKGARIFRLDEHRVGIEFSNLAAGTHRWQLRFVSAQPSGS